VLNPRYSMIALPMTSTIATGMPMTGGTKIIVKVVVDFF
jgi:hypothetical protein